MRCMHLLLVDDERPYIEALARRLAQRGHAVACAFSGAAALERIARDDGIDVVVLDIQMPGMDGLHTLAAIKRDHPLVEVIMLTGHATVQAAVDAVGAGAFDFIEKPCDLERLIDRAAAAAKRRRDRSDRLLRVRTTPYLSDRERREKIAAIMNS